MVMFFAPFPEIKLDVDALLARRKLEIVDKKFSIIFNTMLTQIMKHTLQRVKLRTPGKGALRDAWVLTLKKGASGIISVAHIHNIIKYKYLPGRMEYGVRNRRIYSRKAHQLIAFPVTMDQLNYFNGRKPVQDAKGRFTGVFKARKRQKQPNRMRFDKHGNPIIIRSTKFKPFEPKDIKAYRMVSYPYKSTVAKISKMVSQVKSRMKAEFGGK